MFVSDVGTTAPPRHSLPSDPSTIPVREGWPTTRQLAGFCGFWRGVDTYSTRHYSTCGWARAYVDPKNESCPMQDNLVSKGGWEP